MKTLRRTIIAILLIVLVCATFVACNDDNNPPANENEQQIVEKKVTADPDPNNPYDVDENPKDYSGLKEKFDGDQMVIVFTNSESLNNLFYDYSIQDFDIEKFSSMQEDDVYALNSIRDLVKNGNNDKKIKEYTRPIRLFLKTPDKDALLQYIDEFLQDKGVLYAFPVIYGEWFKSANDVGINQDQRDVFESIQLYDAWDTTTGSSNVTVGLIDSGVNINTDLVNNISNFACGTNPYIDEVPHGSYTAQIIGAKGNNTFGTSGVCWDVKIASLKSCVGNSNEDPQLVINAINYATNNGIKLLNFSGGFYSDQTVPYYYNQLKNAIDAFPGLLIVAAGNENYDLGNKYLYPQTMDCDNMIVVGASNANDERWYERSSLAYNYSATMVDLFAPGYARVIKSDGTFYSETATSFAAPYVTGVAALIMSMKTNISTAALKNAIMKSVDKIDALTGKCVSGGRLNADAAVLYATHTHNKATTDFVNLGVTKGHTAKCRVCDYDVVEGHTWITVGPALAPKGYQCVGCGFYTKMIPTQSLLNIGDTFEKEAVLVNGIEMMAVSDDVAIIKGEDGRYYILVACDENGEIANDIVEDINIPWLKDLIANEVSKVKDEKD